MNVDYDIGARTMYGEGRGEAEAGQRAIAHTLVNRVKAKRWGKSLLSVCLWPYQFSCWNFNDPNRKIMLNLEQDSVLLTRYARMIEDAEQGEPDPTHGALYYKVTSLPWPKDWGEQVPPLVTIGNHSFYILKE